MVYPKLESLIGVLKIKCGLRVIFYIFLNIWKDLNIKYFSIYILFTFPIFNSLYKSESSLSNPPRVNNTKSLLFTHTQMVGKKIINTIERSPFSKLSFYLSLIKRCKEIYPMGKNIKYLILASSNIIKKYLVFFLITFKLISLVNIRIFSTYLEIFPCGTYIVERISFDFSLDLEFISYLLQLENDTIFYCILCLIILITLILFNIMIIFIILICLYNYKLYKFEFLIFSMLPLYNWMQIKKRCKIFCFISMNILKVLNSGISAEDLLFVLNFNFNEIFYFINSNKLMCSFMGDDTNKIVRTISENYQPSQENLRNSNTNNDVKIEMEIDTKESDSSDNDSSNNIEDNLMNNIENIHFTDFNVELNLETKYQYLQSKFNNKGIVHNLPYLDWFINLLVKTDGNKINIDNLIETNLNHILKLERETKLNNFAFFRDKPFLINKIDKSPIAYPNIIPVFKGLSIYGEEDKIEDNK